MDNFGVIGETLTSIVNESLEIGEVCSSWKTSVLIPIAKIAGTTDCEKLRGINMLPLCKKSIGMCSKNTVT